MRAEDDITNSKIHIEQTMLYNILIKYVSKDVYEQWRKQYTQSHRSSFF